MDLTNLHEIQRSILEKLGYEEEKTFSELQGDLPSNKVAFHLNQLSDKGVIEKSGDNYRTTKKGREVIIDFLGEETTNPVTLLSLVIIKDGRVYLEKQDSPISIFKDMYILPTDKVRKRERLKETAERIYEDRLGEEPEDIEYKGVFDKKVTLKDGVEQKYLLFYVKTEYRGDKEDNFYPKDELDSLDIIPGVVEVVDHIYHGKSCFTGECNLKQTDEGFEVLRMDL